MTPDSDPPRWLEGELSASDPLARALQAGRADLPSDASVARIAAGMAAAPLSGAAAGKAVAVAGKGLGLKVAAATAALALAGTGALLARGSGPPPAPPPPRALVETPAFIPPPEPIDTPAPPEAALPAHRPATGTPKRLAPPELSEMELLDQAQRALATDPAVALALLEQHRARFRQGAYAQEREVMAIQALLGLGRREAALRRADDFRAQFPTSAHLPRVEQLIGPDLQKN